MSSDKTYNDPENVDDKSVKNSEQNTSESSQEQQTETGRSAEETQASENQDEAQELSETEALQQELEKEKDKFTRLFAEFENYKRRTSKERVELFKTAGQEVMQSMLPVLDDFDRAIGEIKKSADKGLLEGVELINSKLRETLRNKGLQEMKVKEGDKFDADLHEAITQIPAPKKKLKGKVVDIVEKGYTLGDKIIRFPKVVTGK